MGIAIRARQRFVHAAFLALAAWLFAAGCSTTKVTPLPELPEVPAYTKVPHPTSPELSEIRAIFQSPEAPTSDKLKDCDKDFQKLRSLVQSKDELQQGALEFVGSLPEEYHWCFYWQFVQLEDKLKSVPYHDDRMAEVLKTYAFVTPIALAFKDEFKDTRYLRTAAYQYKNVSERVFVRKLALTQDGAQALFLGNQTGAPHSLWKGFKPGETPLLEKYGFGPPSSNADAVLNAPAPPTNEVPAPAPGTAAQPPAQDNWQKEFDSLDAEMNGQTPPANAAPAQAGPAPAEGAPIETTPGPAPASVQAPAAEPAAQTFEPDAVQTAAPTGPADGAAPAAPAEAAPAAPADTPANWDNGN